MRRGLAPRHGWAHGLKCLLARAGLMAGAAAWARARQGARLRIVMYHGVVARLCGPAAFGNLFIEAEAFARQMRYLQRAFCVISLDEAMALLDTKKRFPDRAVAVTFDDGYRNVLTRALPILQRLRIPTTVFVPAGEAGRGTGFWFDILRIIVAERASGRATPGVDGAIPLDPRLLKANPERAFVLACRRIQGLPRDRAEATIARVLEFGKTDGLLEAYPEFALAGWDEWRAAVADGLLMVGSHGMRHGDLLTQSADERLAELRESKHVIEQELRRPCRAVAYPYGRWNAQVADAARRAGYAYAVTVDAGLNDEATAPFGLSRTMVGDKGDFALFCARVSGMWDLLGAAAGLLRMRAKIKAVLPFWVRHGLLMWRSRLTQWPPPRWVQLGSLRRLTPVSPRFSFGRGLSIDRYYIERFLDHHAGDIAGDVLEIGDPTYTKRFGGARVTGSCVLHVVDGNPQATIVADLSRADHLPAERFDGVICTQTLQYIYDVRAAVSTLHRLLKPGGVALVSVPGISQISRFDMDRWGEYWRFTTLSAQRLFEDCFPGGEVTVEAHGNVLAAVAFLHGLAAEELRPDELDFRDPNYEVAILIRAVKS